MELGFVEPAPLSPLFSAFDRLRQALNDGSALYARYMLLHEYLLEKGVHLPERLER